MPTPPLSAAAEPAPLVAAPKPLPAAPRQQAPAVDETTRSAALAATDETRRAQAYNNDYFDEPRDTAPPANDYEPVRRRHRAFGDAAHAFGRFVGRLLVGQTPQQRERRQAMLNQPLPYPNFPAARRAYDKRSIDADTYEDAVWLLRERRRSRINAEKDNLAHGTISQATYETRVDQITAEFRGEWAGASR
jgi:hypothetical protein